MEFARPFGCFGEAELRSNRTDSIVDAHRTTTFAETFSAFFVTRSMNSAPVAFPVVASTVIRLHNCIGPNREPACFLCGEQ